jgi:hypothetical protein
MGKPYADDLRGVAVRLIGEGRSRVEIAELRGISLIRAKILSGHTACCTNQWWLCLVQ